MSDADRLREAFTSGELLRPDSGVLNLVDLSKAVARTAGWEDRQPTRGSIELAELVGPAEHLVFVLADGLGMDLLSGLPEAKFLNSHLAGELRSVFPSSTAVALTSIATGEWPAQHAVTGWWTHIAEIGSAAAIMPFVKRSDGKPLPGLGVDAERVFPAPSLMASVPRDTLALFPAVIADSVYSSYFSGGRARYGYRNLREAIDVILERVRTAQQPTYTYLYTWRVDNAAHAHGTARPEVRGAVLDLDRELQRLALGLALGLDSGARLIVTADHGFLDATREAKHQIGLTNPLLRDLRFPPSGDARVLYLHLADGTEDRVRNYFRDRYPGSFLVISVEEAQCLELLGPAALSPLARSRVGDLMAISTGRHVIEYRHSRGPGRVMSDISHHSGLTPAEMRIPLVLA